MLISIICRFENDHVSLVEDRYADLPQAVTAALELAERAGRDSGDVDGGDGHGPPETFEVCVDGKVELSVAVKRGGLTG